MRSEYEIIELPQGFAVRKLGAIRPVAVLLTREQAARTLIIHTLADMYARLIDDDDEMLETVDDLIGTLDVEISEEESYNNFDTKVWSYVPEALRELSNRMVVLSR
jgi:hypothetical protein